MNYEPYDRIPMQYLIFDAEQNEEFDHSETYGGAAVGCWIKNQTKKNAYLIFKGWIEENGWNVIDLDQQTPITGEDYKENPEGKVKNTVFGWLNRYEWQLMQRKHWAHHLEQFDL